MPDTVITGRVSTELAQKLEELGRNPEWGNVDRVLETALSVFFSGVPRTGPGIMKLLSRLDIRMQTGFQEIRGLMTDIDHELYLLRMRARPGSEDVPSPRADSGTSIEELLASDPWVFNEDAPPKDSETPPGW